MNVSQAHARRFFGMIGPLQIAIIVLVLITAGIHLQYGMNMNPGGFRGGPPGGQPGGPGSRPPGGPGGPGSAAPGGSILQSIPLPLSTLFILNGIGYLVLVIALYLPP